MTIIGMDYEDDWYCTDLKCTHYDGDRCTLGFCDPNIFEDDNKPLHDNKNNVTEACPKCGNVMLFDYDESAWWCQGNDCDYGITNPRQED